MQGQTKMDISQEIIDGFMDVATDMILSVHDAMCYVCTLKANMCPNELRWKVYKNPSGAISRVTTPMVYKSPFVSPSDDNTVYTEFVDWRTVIFGSIETASEFYARLNEDASLIRDDLRERRLDAQLCENAARTIQRAWANYRFTIDTYLNPDTEIGRLRMVLMARKYGMA